MLAVLAAALMVGSAPLAAAQPAPGVVGSTSSRLAELNAAVSAVEAELAAAQATLDVRRADLAAAASSESAAAGAAAAAAAGAEALRREADGLVGAAYAGARTSRLSAALVSTGPQDLLDRMTALDLLGEDNSARLAAASEARVAADRALRAATGARELAGAAAQQAFEAQGEVVSRRATLVALSAEAAALLPPVPEIAPPSPVAVASAASAASAAPTAPTAPVAATAATPGVQDQAVAGRDAVSARASRAVGTRGTLFAQPTVGQITSPFGARWGAQHTGIDIANSIGTPVVAVADGVVTDAGPASGFGLWVRIRHDDGTVSVYGHIDSYSVSAGQRVAAGEQVARMGNRGQSTGPHLHLEVVTPGGTKVDPQAWLAERGVPV